MIDVAVTPNRQDAMGVHGIARDLAAAGLGTLKPVDVPVIPGTWPCPVEIAIEDPEGCPVFYGRAIRGVRNGPSPDWLQQRLKAVGQRPISALVDMTNYITLSYGRPLHVFDLAKLRGNITARRARDGEELLALNGKTYRLDPSITAIADEAGADGIGGIMGGERTSVDETTTDILIECAWFDPERIALSGQKLGLTSDARSRFERGADPAFVEAGIQLGTALVVELAGGEPSQVFRAGKPPVPDRKVDYRPEITPDELLALAKNYDVIVVRSRTKITKPVIDSAAKVKIIARVGVGLDNIDTEYAESKGIRVINAAEAAVNAVGELVIGDMIALARSIPKSDSALKDGKWIKKELMGIELKGKYL